MPRSGTLGLRLLAAALAAGLVAMLTLAPRAFVAPARSRFMDTADALLSPLTATMSYADAERMLNAAMFLPLGAAVALLLDRRLWPIAMLAGFVVSFAVEVAQASIPGRVPDPNDVVWNTIGCAVAVTAVTLGRVVWAGADRARQRGRSTRT